MDREAWCAAVHGVTKSRIRLSNWTELSWTDLREMLLSLPEVHITSLPFSLSWPLFSQTKFIQSFSLICTICSSNMSTHVPYAGSLHLPVSLSWIHLSRIHCLMQSALTSGVFSNAALLERPSLAALFIIAILPKTLFIPLLFSFTSWHFRALLSN